MVDLVKAAGAEGIGLAAEGVQNVALTVQNPLHLAQHHAGLAIVHILHDGGDGQVLLFRLGQQRFDKVLCTGQHRLRRYQHHHHLPALHAPAQQTVAHKAGALVFVIGLIAAGNGRRTHGLHGLIQHFILQQAAFHRQHLVAVRRIDAGREFSTPAGGKGGDHLVPIMIRLLHAPDGVHRTEFAQQLFHGIFLCFQLRGVVHSQHRASAAVLCTQFAIHFLLSFFTRRGRTDRILPLQGAFLPEPSWPVPVRSARNRSR